MLRSLSSKQVERDTLESLFYIFYFQKIVEAKDRSYFRKQHVSYLNNYRYMIIIFVIIRALIMIPNGY